MKTINSQQKIIHLNPARKKIPYPICRRGLCKILAKSTKSNQSSSSDYSQNLKHDNFNNNYHFLKASQRPQSVKSSRKVLNQNYKSQGQKPKSSVHEHKNNSKSFLDLPEFQPNSFLKNCYQQISEQRKCLLNKIQEKDKQLVNLKISFQAAQKKSSRKNLKLLQNKNIKQHFYKNQALYINFNQLESQKLYSQSQMPINKLYMLKRQLQSINIQKVLQKKKVKQVLNRI